MSTGLGTLQKKIIRYIDSQPYKMCKQSEIRKHFYDPNRNKNTQKNQINDCIKGLILPPRSLIIHVKTRDFKILEEDLEYYDQEKRYFSKFLTLDYTKEDVQKVLKD